MRLTVTLGTTIPRTVPTGSASGTPMPQRASTASRETRCPETPFLSEHPIQDGPLECGGTSSLDYWAPEGCSPVITSMPV